MELTEKQEDILNQYIELVKIKKRTLIRADLYEIGLNRDNFRNTFGTLEKLEETARELYPEVFLNIVDKTLFTDEYFEDIKKDVGNYKKFVITTAVCGVDNLNIPFFNTLNKYCEFNNAKLLVLPVQDPADRFCKLNWNLDNSLKDTSIVFQDLSLNSNIAIRGIKLTAKMIDPTTGLDRLGQRGGSFVFGSPKQRLKYVAVGETKLAHALMSTGCVTMPSYGTELYISQRTAYLAENDHVNGAVIVEIVDDKLFHFRQIQARSDGSFWDVGKLYTQTSIQNNTPPEAFVLGDWHSGSTDPIAKKTWFNVIHTLQPKCLVLHDFFDGRFNNHHDVNKLVTRAKLAKQQKTSLQKEIEQCIKDLNDITSIIDKVYLVRSNHDEVLERYIEESRFVSDYENTELASQLVSPMINGHMCLKYLVENLHLLTNSTIKLKNPEKLTWLRRDDSLLIEGVECGAHGDVGTNGSRANVRNLELAYGRCIVGHAHTPEIFRKVFRVGTSSYLKLPYTKGPSSWFHTSALLSKDGCVQLINALNGKWCL